MDQAKIMHAVSTDKDTSKSAVNKLTHMMTTQAANKQAMAQSCKRQKTQDSLPVLQQTSEQGKRVDMLTSVRPASLVLDFVSNYQFDEVAFDDSDARLKFLKGESLLLGDSMASEPVNEEYCDYLWFGHLLKQAADALATASSSIIISMEAAVPFRWDVIDNDQHIVAQDVSGWLMNAGLSRGDIKPCQLFRLYKFMHGDHVMDHWKWNNLRDDLLEQEDDNNNGSSNLGTVYGQIAHLIERRSVWWSREQHLWQQMVASKPFGTGNDEDNEDDKDEAENEDDDQDMMSTHPYHAMFQQYLRFVDEAS